MNSENLSKATNQAIEQLMTALNEGRSEAVTQYLAAIDCCAFTRRSFIPM